MGKNDKEFVPLSEALKRPDKELELAEKIIAQNQKIIEMNEKIIATKFSKPGPVKGVMTR